MHINSDFAGKHVLGLSLVFLALHRFTGQQSSNQYSFSQVPVPYISNIFHACMSTVVS